MHILNSTPLLELKNGVYINFNAFGQSKKFKIKITIGRKIL